jgi:hypothetical protein
VSWPCPLHPFVSHTLQSSVMLWGYILIVSPHTPLSPGLLASVPSCVEDLSHPVAEPGSNQAGSISSMGE